MAIVLLEPIHPEAHERLASAAQVHLVEEPAEVAATAAVQALITRGRGQVRRTLIERLPHLKVVGRVGVGLDNIDVDAASEHGVLVINTPGSTTTAVAEHTLMLMAALVRGLYGQVRAVKGGDWAYRGEYRGDELSGKTLGVIGMGDIGQRVAKLAEAFGMEVVYWSRSEKDVPYPRLPFEEVLRRADVVSLHLALTPETRHLLGREALAALKPGALLVNTSRGAVLDQKALLEALDEGTLAGFAADVLAQEPPDPADPLLHHDRVLITPHTAALTETTFRRMSLRTVGNVLAALRGEPVEAGCIANK